MKPLPFQLPLLILAASTLAMSAQTSHTTTHTTSHATTHTAYAHTASHRGGACISYPDLSAKIPALPAGASCPRALFTITKHPELTLDYKAPVITGDYLENTFGTKATTITLGYVDIVKGTGELAKPDMYYTVKYAGYLPDGTEFDASDKHPGKAPLTFPYGKHQVIAGWDTGFEGMRVGGKRRIFVPYELAYGDAGKPPTIPAKSLLIFDLELVSESATMPKPVASAKPAPSAFNKEMFEKRSNAAGRTPSAAAAKPEAAKPEAK